MGGATYGDGGDVAWLVSWVTSRRVFQMPPRDIPRQTKTRLLASASYPMSVFADSKSPLSHRSATVGMSATRCGGGGADRRVLVPPMLYADAIAGWPQWSDFLATARVKRGEKDVQMDGRLKEEGRLSRYRSQSSMVADRTPLTSLCAKKCDGALSPFDRRMATTDS